MNVLTRGIILTVFLVTLGVPCALATSVDHLDPPHNWDPIDCKNCHTRQDYFNSAVGFTNSVCMTCHRPGGRAEVRPFSPNDASNVFNSITTTRTGKIMQTSHNFAGKMDVPRAGAITPPLNTPFNDQPTQLGKFPMGPGLSCFRCHSVHGQEGVGNKLLRKTEKQEICLECHVPRNTVDHTTGSHPVTVTYATAIKKFSGYKFYTTPVNANPDNSTSVMLLKDGKVLCSTCHGMHFSDSNSRTFDNFSSVLLGRLSSSKGYILRTDMRGATPNSINICTNCHRGKYAHNGKNQNIQCADCHAGHVDEGDGTKPNVWLIRRYMQYSTGTFKLDNRTTHKPTFFQSTTVKNYRDADNKSGVCQACHVLPTTVPQHSQPDVNCNACHYHENPKGSFTPVCDTCHGQPPSANTVGGPSGYAAGYTRADESKTPHTTHVGTYAFVCNDCHMGNIHIDGNYDLFRSMTTGSRAASHGATPKYDAATMTCSTVYCHSNGAPRGVTPAYATTPPWKDGKGAIVGTTGECSACHGDAANLATNAHQRHANPTIGKGFPCETCHAATVATVNGKSTIKDISRHVNGFKNISITTTAAGIAASAGTMWNTATATCSTIYCHSNGKGAFKSPVWTNIATGACNTCHNATAPVIETNAHTAHFTANYGPKFAAVQTSCANCHTFTTEIAATHVNGVVEAPVVNCTTKCHGNGVTIAEWSAGKRLACERCHTGTRSVFNNVTAPDKSLSVTAGHTNPIFTNKPTCQSCHDDTAAHISGALGVNVRLKFANDNSLCASCHSVVGNVNDIAFRSMSSTHFTARGTADMLCKTCHDPHGTSNRKMIRSRLTWTNATAYTITYNDAVYGLVDQTRTTNRGLCQVCHTKTKYWLAGKPEYNHPTYGCLECHIHKAKGGAFKPPGASPNFCNGCHGYPPMPRTLRQGVDFGIAGKYSSARFENYTGGGGAHAIAAHVAPNVTPAGGWTNCAKCHNGGLTGDSPNHRMIWPILNNISNVTLNLDQKLRFNSGQQAIYTGALHVYPGNKTGTCVNVACHFKPSPQWGQPLR